MPIWEYRHGHVCSIFMIMASCAYLFLSRGHNVFRVPFLGNAQCLTLGRLTFRRFRSCGVSSWNPLRQNRVMSDVRYKGSS